MEVVALEVRTRCCLVRLEIVGSGFLTVFAAGCEGVLTGVKEM